MEGPEMLRDFLIGLASIILYSILKTLVDEFWQRRDRQ